MKKVLGLLAITGFVACSNGTGSEAKVDSAAIKDSIAKVEATAKAAADSAAKAAMDTTHKAAGDTSHKAAPVAAPAKK